MWKEFSSLSKKKGALPCGWDGSYMSTCAIVMEYSKFFKSDIILLSVPVELFVKEILWKCTTEKNLDPLELTKPCIFTYISFVVYSTSCRVVDSSGKKKIQRKEKKFVKPDYVTIWRYCFGYTWTVIHHI